MENEKAFPKSAFRLRADRAAVRWKTTRLPAAAHARAPYSRHGRDGRPSILCLPWEHALLNLLGPARAGAPIFFAEKGIRWHDSLAGGPSNHLLDSQVQCVNALWPMTHDPRLVKRAFGDALPIAEVLPVEDDLFLTFEFIGTADVLGEAPGVARSRGSMSTSADAAFRYRTPDGGIELALVEWKYTEDYRERELSPDRRGVREQRYAGLWADPQSPLRHGVIPYEDLFVEPFYQLMRQQLMAWRLTESAELGAARVRVVHVAPGDNDGFAASLNRDSHRAAGDDVLTVWRSMLKDPTTFVSIDAGRFADREFGLTTDDYCERYGS